MNQQVRLQIHATRHTDTPACNAAHADTRPLYRLTADSRHHVRDILQATLVAHRATAFGNYPVVVINDTSHQIRSSNIKS